MVRFVAMAGILSESVSVVAGSVSRAGESGSR